MTVLAEIDTAVTAPPLLGLSALQALDNDAPIDFRRIQIDGVATGQTWHVYRPEGGIQWQPFRVVDADGPKVLVGFPAFEDQVKQTASQPTLDGLRAGYVRRIRPTAGLGTWIGPDDNAADNRWFAINPDGGWLPGADVYIDLHSTERDAGALPVRRPEIANNHVSYMLTWWSFALIMLIIYAILHRRAGRLTRS